MNDLALISRAARYHQDGETLHANLKATVSAAMAGNALSGDQRSQLGQGGKLITSQSRDNIRRAHRQPTRCGHLAQHRIAGGVAGGVIQGLEPIEIDRHDCRRVVKVMGLAKHGAKLLFKVGSIDWQRAFFRTLPPHDRPGCATSPKRSSVPSARLVYE